MLGEGIELAEPRQGLEVGRLAALSQLVEEPAHVVATGPISGTGALTQQTDGESRSGDVHHVTLRFDRGTVRLALRLTPRGEGWTRVNCRTCTAKRFGRGTLTITGRTGAYKGAAGQGRFEQGASLSPSAPAVDVPRREDAADRGRLLREAQDGWRSRAAVGLTPPREPGIRDTVAREPLLRGRYKAAHRATRLYGDGASRSSAMRRAKPECGRGGRAVGARAAWASLRRRGDDRESRVQGDAAVGPWPGVPAVARSAHRFGAIVMSACQGNAGVRLLCVPGLVTGEEDRR